MSTRARIGIELADGTVLSSYCHNDGYMSGLGILLVDHYSDAAKLLEAINLGDASTWGTVVHPTGEHTFASREQGVNVYYERDRNEEDCGPWMFDNMKEFVNCSNEDFGYAYTLDGLWLCANECDITSAGRKKVNYDAAYEIEAEAAGSFRLTIA